MKKLKEINFSELVKLAEKQDFPAIEALGNGLYRLPGGIVTGSGGVAIFDEEVRKYIKEHGTEEK